MTLPVPGGRVHKYGRNPNIGASSEAIWSVGGAYSGFLTSASLVRIASGGNAADDSSGAGARTVRIEGLDENWELYEETLTLAGASASASSSRSFVRIWRAVVDTCGTYGGTNTGDIDIETTGSVLLARIVAGESQTQMAVWTVPAGRRALLKAVGASVDSTQDIDITFWSRSNADQSVAPFGAARVRQYYAGVTGLFQIGGATRYLESLPDLTDIWMTGGNSVAADVAGWFDLTII